MKILSQREQYALRVLGWSDKDYNQHRARLEQVLNDLDDRGIDTRSMRQYGHVGADGRPRWSRERRRQHQEIVRHFYNQMQNTPQEGKGLILGGLGGAGKGHAMAQPDVPLDASNYYRIDPDEIKKEMVRRGMVPDVPGLSPMESSGLAHEEASDLAKRIAMLGYREKRNLAWDITMSSDKSVAKRIADMRRHGYGQVDGAFIDAHPDVARARVIQRHRKDEEPFRDAGAGTGGRYVQERLTQNHYPTPGSGMLSKNAEVFNRLRPQFDNSLLIDSNTSQPRVVNQHGTRWASPAPGLTLPTWQPTESSPGVPQQQSPPGLPGMPTRSLRNPQASRRVAPGRYVEGGRGGW